MDSITIAIIAMLIAMMAGGIYSLFKYKKTKKKKYLIIGLILTLVIVGILIFLFLVVPNTIVAYGPAPSGG